MTEIILGTLLLTAIVLVLTITVIAARSVLVPSRPVVVTVNEGETIDARTGDRLLGVLQDAGILIPSACAGAGTCGLCRVKVTAGGPEALPTETAMLTRAELRDGVHLSCQVVVRNEMEVEVPADMLGAEQFDTKVRSARFLTPLIREIVLDLPDGVRPDIIAGSFVQITAPAFSLSYADLAVPDAHHGDWEQLRGLSVTSDAPVTRAYSISNRPEDTAAGRIVLNIRLALPPPDLPNVPPGVVSSWLFDVNEGDTIVAAGPFGTFRAQPGDREMVFIGGGVGMAPLRAIIWEQLEQVGTSRKISFWYGARSKAELFYADEFTTLAAKHDNFTWTVALSDPAPDDDWQGAVGFVHTVAWENYLRDHPAPEDCEYYLCGPPLMIRAVQTMLDDAGVDPAQVYNDDFGV